MPIELESIEETCSLLVPAYVIARDAPGESVVIPASGCIGPYQDEDHTYSMMRRDEWYVLPRGTSQFMYGASALFNDAVARPGRRAIRLREADEPMPPNLLNTCLMVSGSRTCARRLQDRSDIFRGYAAWANASASHHWISSLSRSTGDARGCLSKSVVFGRAGRGVLYAPVEDGRARVLLLDFHIADSDEASPDLLFIWASRSEVRPGDLPRADPRGERLDDGWQDLVREAMDGYRSEGGP